MYEESNSMQLVGGVLGFFLGLIFAILFRPEGSDWLVADWWAMAILFIIPGCTFIGVMIGLMLDFELNKREKS